MTVNNESGDRRYEYVTCQKCGKQWQRIDWNCSLHQVTCGEQPQNGIDITKQGGLTEGVCCRCHLYAFDGMTVVEGKGMQFICRRCREMEMGEDIKVRINRKLESWAKDIAQNLKAILQMNSPRG
jgi:hypothetical protein